MNNIEELQKIINESKSIVFFGGAGVSTASGIPDFRSEDGLYNQKCKYPPEIVLSNSFFFTKTDDFYDFYKAKFNLLKARPNVVHKYLAKLEKCGKLKAIITQNVDGLHTKAGNKNVYEIHGTIYKNHCLKCKKEYDAKYVFNSKGIPTCECGGIIKPDVVLYGESLNDSDVADSIDAIKNCDTLIIAGTSLNVYPATGFIKYFKGKNLVMINKQPTQYDNKASLIIKEDMKEIFNSLTI
jgi:NAD-dependent deacetylase